MSAVILNCSQPGCTRIVRAFIEVKGYLCWEHAPSAGWPRSDEPCSDDFDCGTTCFRDGDEFVYEGTRVNGFGADEDCQFYCKCEHHEGAKR